MSALPSAQSPLARLVLFMVVLSVAGSMAAGVHYYAVDLPQQQFLPAPENSGMSCQECYAWCVAEHPNSDGCKYNCLIYACP